MTFPQFGAYTTDTAGTGTNGDRVDLAAPDGLAAGDYQVVVVSYATGAVTFPEVDGWSKIVDAQVAGGASSSGRVVVYESTTAVGPFACLTGGNRVFAAARANWKLPAGSAGRTVARALLVEPSGSAATAHTLPDVTTTAPDSLVIGIGVSDQSNSVPPGTQRWTGFGTYAPRVDLVGPNAVEPQAVGIADLQVSTPGEVDGQTWVTESADECGLVVIVLDGVTTAPTTATFGKTTPPASSSTSNTSRVMVSRAVPAATGTVQTGHARVWQSASKPAGTLCKFAIYADASGAPGALLAESDPITITASSDDAERLFTFPAAQQIEVTAGTAYWIGPAWADADPSGNTVGMTFGRDSDDLARFEQNFTWPTLPASYGTPVANNDGPMAAYVTYSTTPAGPPIVDAGRDALGAVGREFVRVGTIDPNGSPITGGGWEILSGPDGVGDGNNTEGFALDPTQPGTYVVEFRATNAFGTSRDTMTLTVYAIEGGGGTARPAHAGEGMWIGAAAGKNHGSIDIGLGTTGGTNDLTIQQDQIEAGEEVPNRFFLRSHPTEGWVVEYRINAGASKTSENTKFPRSEQRERNEAGGLAAWNGATGTHRMRYRVAVSEVADPRSWVCVGQIHDANKDVLRIQSQGNGLTGLDLVARWNDGSGEQVAVLLDGTYSVGQFVDLEILVVNDVLTISVDGVERFRQSGMNIVGGYFKWGCYLQVDVVEYGADPTDEGATQIVPGTMEIWHTGYASPTEPVFTGPGSPFTTRRFYLSGTAAPEFTWVPTYLRDGAGDGSQAANSHRLTDAPEGAAGTATVTDATATTPWWMLLGQWVSHPATEPGIVGTTHRAVLGLQESAAAADITPSVSVYVMSPEPESRGSAVNFLHSTRELPTTAAALELTSTDPGSVAAEQVFAPGDRIVVAIAARAMNEVATPYTASIRRGGTTSPDLAAGDTGSALSRPSWVDLQITPGIVFEPDDPQGLGEAAAVELSAVGTGRKHTEGLAEVAPLALDLTGTGRRIAAGTGRTALALDVITTGGHAVRNGAGTAALDLHADSTAGPVDRAGSATIAAVLDVHGTGARSTAGLAAPVAVEVATTGGGTSAATGTGHAPAVDLAAAGAGDRAADGATPVTVDLGGVHGTGRRVAVGRGRAAFALTARGSGTGARQGTATAVALDAVGTGRRATTGSGDADVPVVATMAAAPGIGSRRGHGSSTLRLRSRGEGRSSTEAWGEAPPVELETSGTGTRAASGAGASSSPSLTAAATGQRIGVGRGSSTVALGVSGEAAVRVGAGTVPPVQLAATAEGWKVAHGRGTTALALTAPTGSGHRTVPGRGRVGLQIGGSADTGSGGRRGGGAERVLVDVAGAGHRGGRGGGASLLAVAHAGRPGRVARQGGGADTVHLSVRSAVVERLATGAGRVPAALDAVGTGSRLTRGRGVAVLALDARPQRVVPGSHIATASPSLLVATATPL